MLHLDAEAFLASVKQLDDQRLAGRAVSSGELLARTASGERPAEHENLTLDQVADEHRAVAEGEGRGRCVLAP